MTTNKADIIELALDKASLAGSLFNPDPRTTEVAAKLLELMMPALEADGIRIGWIKDIDPMRPTIDSDAGIPDWTMHAISSMLANNICQALMISRPDLESMSASLKRQLYPTELIQRDCNTMMPVGQGNRSSSRAPIYQGSQEHIDVEQDGRIEDFFD